MWHLLAESSSSAGGAELVLIGGIVAAANVLGEVAKTAVGALRQKNNKTSEAADAKTYDAKACTLCQSQVRTICETVSRCDESGTPLVYSGYRLIEKMDLAVDEMRRVSRSQERMVACLELTVSKGDSHGKSG